jgi:rSAM-associated Gly-rich repeat protein
MLTTPRASLLFLLLAFHALIPAAAVQADEGPPMEVEARLDRISQALLERAQAPDGAPSGGDGTLLARGFVNGAGPRGFVNGANRGFANANTFYGTSRGFVNGGGGFVNARPGGGFVNAPRPGVGFVNW